MVFRSCSNLLLADSYRPKSTNTLVFLVLLEEGRGKQAGEGTGCSFQNRFLCLTLPSSLKLETNLCFRNMNQVKPFDSLGRQNLSRAIAE